jgi:sec-independent protein translocase protein TatC
MNETRKKTNSKKQKEMPFLEHLEELRWRILKSLGSVVLFTVLTFPFTGILLTFLTFPNEKLKAPAELIFLKPTGMLMVRLEIAIVVGIIASLPVLFYQFWQFISPGLLPKEKRYFLPALFFTTFCFLAGTAFSYFILIPTVLPFLFSMGTEDIKATLNITEFMSFVLRLILISGLIFELPILSFVLSVTGIVKPKMLKKYRKYGIVIIFILAAFLTPPDPISQLLMALPLLVLYEISIWVSYLGNRKKREKDEAWEEEFNSKQSKKNNKKAAE